MGSDIHVVLETRYTFGSDDECWIGLHACPYIRGTAEVGNTNLYLWPMRERNYKRFAALAGVRGPGPEPRGLPENASSLARMESDGWGDDGHSHSWLPLRDAVRVYLATEYDPAIVFLSKDNPLVDRAYGHYFGLSHLDDAGLNDAGLGSDSPDNYRIVFWFDN